MPKIMQVAGMLAAEPRPVRDGRIEHEQLLFTFVRGREGKVELTFKTEGRNYTFDLSDVDARDLAQDVHAVIEAL